MEPQTRTGDVTNCPQCGLDHGTRTFFRKKDGTGADSHPLWYTFCPEEANPIALVLDKEGKEKIVAIN